MNLIAHRSRACPRAALALVRHLAPLVPSRQRSIPLVMLLTLVTPAASFGDRGPVGTAAAPPATVPLPTDFVPDEVLLAFRSGVPQAEEAAVERSISATRVKWQPALRYAKLKLPAGASVVDAVESLARDPRVLWVEPNGLYSQYVCQSCPQDPMLKDGPNAGGDQWGVYKTGVFWLWRHGGGGSASTKIAIVDTGIDNFAAPHPDLAANVLAAGHDFVDEDANPTDDGPYAGHGTHVAGIAAAEANALGIAGIAYCSSILVVRVLSCDDPLCTGTWEDIADGIQYAADQGARVINLSLGGQAESNAVRTAVYHALGQGSIVVAASGNDYLNTVGFPARIPEVIAVGATDATDAVAAFSNWGTNLDVVAPGVAIWSSIPGGGYDDWQGTSMAAPFVSGIVALLAERNPSLTASEAETYLKEHTKNLPGPDDGSGRVDFTALEDWSDAPGYPAVRHQLSFWEWLGEDATAEKGIADANDSDGRPNTGGAHDTDAADDGAFPLSFVRLPYGPPHIGAGANLLDAKESVCRFDGPRYGAAAAKNLHLDSWFDWNSNLVFANTAVEREVSDHAENPGVWGGNSKTVTLAITPPDEHILGNPLVVRTRLAYGASTGAPDATPTATGEVEDVSMINFVEDFDITLHTIEPGIYMTFEDDGWGIMPDPIPAFGCGNHFDWHLAATHHPGGAASIPCNNAIEQVNVMSTPVMDWSEYTEAHLRFWFCHQFNPCSAIEDHCRVVIDTCGVKTTLMMIPMGSGPLAFDLSSFVGCPSVKIEFVEDTDWYGVIAIDDVRVWAFDDEKVQGVTDLAVSRISGSRNLDLTWTSPNENGAGAPPATDPQANVYRLRYSANPITNLADWEKATPFTPADVVGAGTFPKPKWPGAAELVSLRAPSAFQSYCVALRTDDEVVNTSVLSNSACDATVPALGVNVLALGDTTAAPGDTTLVLFNVENTGNVADTYVLEASGSRPWLLAPDTEIMPLASGADGVVAVVVFVPITALPGQVDSVTLRATSLSNPSVEDFDVALVEIGGACSHLDDHDAGNIRLSVTDQASLGYLEDSGPGSGFVFPIAGGPNRLFIGGFMAGTGSAYMLNRDYTFDPVDDWQTAGCLVAGPPGDWSESWAATFSDAGHPLPRGLAVDQTSYVWGGASDDDYVIVRYAVRNDGATPIAGLWTGVNLDWDIDTDGGFDQNRGDVDVTRNLAYMWREGGGDGAYVGVRVLAPATAPKLTFVHNPTYVYPDHYLHDADRFHFLSGDDPSYVVMTTPSASDWSAVAGMGPFSLAPGDTGWAAVALVAGTSLPDLLANADAVAAKWQEIFGGTTGVAEQDASLLPERLVLAPASPNPFRGRTAIAFDLPARSSVALEIFDVSGRLMARIAEGVREAGRHVAAWNGHDRNGRPAAGGIYFVRLSAAGETKTQKIVLTR